MHIFIYDGQCGLCVAFRDWLMERARPGTFETIPFGDSRLSDLLPGKSAEQIEESAHVITPTGRLESGHAAIRVVITQIPYLRWLSPILSLPFLDPLFRFIYSQVSARRYRDMCRWRARTH